MEPSLEPYWGASGLPLYSRLGKRALVRFIGLSLYASANRVISREHRRS